MNSKPNVIDLLVWGTVAAFVGGIGTYVFTLTSNIL